MWYYNYLLLSLQVEIIETNNETKYVNVMMVVGIDATVEDPEVSFLIQNKYQNDAVKQVNQVKISEPFVVCVACCRSGFSCIPSLIVRAKFI